MLKRRAGWRARVHLLGLCSDGGVHSALEHLLALIALARELRRRASGRARFTDGRDTLPHARRGYIGRARDGAQRGRRGSRGGVIGRYCAMDRDRRWERTQRAYDLLVHAQRATPRRRRPCRRCRRRTSGARATSSSSRRSSAARRRIGAADVADRFNFSPDRMRELMRALAEPGFGERGEELPGWRGRGGAAPGGALVTMTEYEEGWPYPVAFAPERPATTLAGVLARAGATQLHVAETEKYAARDLLLQRRRGGSDRGRAARARALAARRADVRQASPR